MNSFDEDAAVSLEFTLQVEDEWPPVTVESIPFRDVAGRYVALAPPLFVKGLSAGDTIEASFEANSRRVGAWHHVSRSAHSTIWLLRMRDTENLAGTLAKLRQLGCTTVSFEEAGAYAIDVPGTVTLQSVDCVLDELDPESIAVAFPSLRHEAEQDDE